MALADNEMLDRALDVAETKISVKEDTANDNKENLEEDIAVSKVLEAESKPTESRDRDQTGKFTKAKRKKSAPVEAAKEEQDLSDQATVVEDLEATPTEPESEPIEIPNYWPPELKNAAKEAPQALVKEFAKAWDNVQDFINRKVAEAEPAVAFRKRIYSGFEAVKDEARLNGINDPAEELERYRSWDNIFKRDPSTGIIDLGRKNNITPEMYAELYYGGEQTAPSADPRIEEALNEARLAKKQLEEFQTRTTNENLNNQIENFKNGKDSAGQVRRQFTELYAPQIAMRHEQVMSENPGLSFNQALEKAYEDVLANARKAFGVSSKPVAQAKPVQKVDVKKAQAIASSTTGAPSLGKAGARPSAKTIDEALDRAEERVYSGMR